MPSNYALPLPVLTDLAIAIFFRKNRGFSQDAARCVRTLSEPLQVLGEENIPTHGPALITANHYWNPPFFAPWISLAISSVTQPDICWVMANAWTSTNPLFGSAWYTITHWVFTRVTRVYGLIPMPPMPPRPEEAAERALSVRKLMARLKTNPQAVIGLIPEGSDQPGGLLNLPPPGVGRLVVEMGRISRNEPMRIYPVGIYEENDRLTLNFGQPYLLNTFNNLDRAQVDLFARQQMMQAIARLLPSRLRGEFGEQTQSLPAAVSPSGEQSR